jgi:hypothetical protein
MRLWVSVLRSNKDQMTVAFWPGPTGQKAEAKKPLPSARSERAEITEP